MNISNARVRPRLSTVVRAALRGKTLGRILFNETVRLRCESTSGRVLDLAGGRSPSYVPLLPNAIDLVRTNLSAADGVIIADFNRPLPFADESFDAVLLFNALYIAENPPSLLAEIRRVLRPGGVAYIASPFIANEMPEPHDYMRYTAEGIERLCAEAGFRATTIERVGDRASAAAVLLHPLLHFNVVRAALFPLALMADSLIPHSVRSSHPAPLFYFVVCIR